MVRLFTATMALFLVVAAQGLLAMCGIRCSLPEAGAGSRGQAAAVQTANGQGACHHAVRFNSHQAGMQSKCCERHCSLSLSVSLQARAQAEKTAFPGRHAIPAQAANFGDALLRSASLTAASPPLRSLTPSPGLNIRI